jgi:hypothetical protein
MAFTMSRSRTQRAAALEQSTDRVAPEDLVVADTESLKAIAELAERRSEVEAPLVVAVRTARAADRSWSEIGAMLGVSEQAAQRKDSRPISA